MEKFVGKWEVTSTENMDEMLKAFDMEPEKRKMYSDMKFVMEYTHNGHDQWQYTVLIPNGTTKTFAYTLGQEFDSFTLDGRPIISKVEERDGKFVEIHRDKADPTLDAIMTREVVGDELIVTAKVRNVTSITRHKKL